MNADPLEHRTTPRAAAAWWLNHRRSGDMTAADAQAFQAWLGGDPANRAAYEQLERLWGAVGAAADDPEVMAAREHDARRFNAGARLRWAAAVAACLLVLAGGLSVFSPWRLAPSNAAPTQGRSDILTMIGRGPTEFQTSVGQRTTVRLPDRSVVTLDTDTILRVHDKPGERLVSLERGRAFFRVAKDPSRPFIVAAGGHRVRAIGTAFDVRVGKGRFEVTLIEGRVKVETPSLFRKTASTAQLTPGQRLAIAQDAPQLTQIDLRTETSWHEGRLTFVRDPLVEAVAEMNRYSDKKIVFRGGRTPDKSIIGVFRAGDVESFAKAVTMNGLATVTADTDDYIELSASEKNVAADPSLAELPASF
jgi:transmembrane sensor